ncbi:MAG: SDR family NAD(P)-dependent oxidoreductase [Planctomycetota bacterium]
MSEIDLSHHVAVVTGAGRGIGRAVALGYARAGAAVVCAARTRSEIDETRDIITDAGGRAITVATDVADEPQVIAMYDAAVEAFGGVDIAFINAGVNLDRNLVEESDSTRWAEVIQINLIGAYYCARHAIGAMKAGGALPGGRILLVGSGLGHKGMPTSSAYSCSKAGVWMLTRVLAQEVLGHGITVNEIIPGPVQTAMLAGRNRLSGQGADADGEWVKTPEDVVPMTLFLSGGVGEGAAGPTAQSFSLMRRDT